MLRQSLAITVLLLLAFGVAHSSDPTTDTMRQRGREGSAFADQLLRNAPQVRFDADTGERWAGRVEIVAPGRLLEHIDVTHLVPGASPPEVEYLQALGENPDLLHHAGLRALERAGRDESLYGAGVRTALRSYPSVRELERVAAPLDAVLKNFTTAPGHIYADCATTTTFHDSGFPLEYQVWTEHTCERLNTLDRCERTREVSIDTREIASIPPIRETAITSDQVLRYRVTDYTGEDEIVLDAEARVLQIGGSVAGVSVTEQPSAANGWWAVITIRHNSTACGGVANGCPDWQQWVHAQVSMRYTALRETFVGACLMDSDGWCDAEWRCTDVRPREIGGFRIGPSPIPGMRELYPTGQGHQPPSSLEPVCWRAEARYRCHYAIGTLCWETPTGPHCSTTTPEALIRDTCQQYEQHNRCGLLRHRCVEDARGYGGFCYVEERTYRCAESYASNGWYMRTQHRCQGILACAGDQCRDPTIRPERFDAQSWYRAMGYLTLAQHILNDQSRPRTAIVLDPPPDRLEVGDEGVAAHDGANGIAEANAQTAASHEIRLFTGQPRECRKMLGGTANCCKTAGGQPVAQLYHRIYREHERLSHAEIVASTSDRTPGAWHFLASASPSDQDLRRPLTTLRESILAYMPGGRDAHVWGAKRAITSPHGGSPELVHVQESFTERARAHMPRLGWYCSRDEWDLATNRQVGNCLTVGSYCKRRIAGMCLDKREAYCCFSSPMSRMIREHLARKAGIDRPFGSAKRPDCSGIIPDDGLGEMLADMPLDEWTGRLAQAGMLPTASDLAAMNADTLTGSGSTLAGGQYRADVKLRTDARLAAIDGDRARTHIAADQAAKVPDPPQDALDSGELTWSPAFTHGHSGQVITLRVLRSGGTRGPAVARVRAHSDTAHAGRDYIPLDAVVTWGPGEGGEKLLALQTVANDAPYPWPRELTVMLEPLEGARPGPTLRARVRIYRP